MALVNIPELKEGEYLVECPYDPCHQVKNTRSIRHIMKCQKNYFNKMASLGLPPDEVMCRFDCGMTTYVYEIETHEKICNNRPPFTDEEHLHDPNMVALARKLWAEERQEFAESMKKMFGRTPEEIKAEQEKLERDKQARNAERKALGEPEEEDWDKDPPTRQTFTLFKGPHPHQRMSTPTSTTTNEPLMWPGDFFK